MSVLQSRLISSVLMLFIPALTAECQLPKDKLQAGFEDPPQSARPQVWWHWMNGNITKEGIKLDIEWMHRIGLGGFHNFDAALDTPQVVPNRLAYMTPEWKDAFKYAIGLADQYGLKAGIAGSPGWSESGGPWVAPAQGMKKYVWSEVIVAGGKPFSGKLPHPPSTTGPFQNVLQTDWPKGKSLPEFYEDAAVVAFRNAATDVSIESLHPKMSASGGSPNYALLSDGDVVKSAQIQRPKDEDATAWIEYAFEQPITIRAVTVAMSESDEVAAASGGRPVRTLEASEDGTNFREAAKLGDGSGDSNPEETFAFAPVTAKFFRVVFKPNPPKKDETRDSSDANKAKPNPNYDIAELVLHPGARVNQWQEKAAFSTEDDLYRMASPASASGDAIAKADVIDLTGRMKSDGTLEWTPPEGTWTVLRIGTSLLGITNHPATAEATGLEVDKLDHVAVKDYFEKYLDSYKQTVGPEMMGKRGISFVINDSWEAGSENWTGEMIAKFKRLRGYDPTPWLPVLTGRVVGSAAESDRFLWDLRKTIADLIAEEHYHTLEDVLHEHNMIHYGESHEYGRALIADGMEVKKFNEVPMSAIWTQSPGVNKETFDYNADDRESASVAHIYGQNIAAAESMTASEAPWGWSPATLKPTADQELLNGINRIVIHESAHQPLIGKAPGLTLGPFGQWFNRNETWAEQAKPWITYLARSSYLLQQGHFAADIIYFYGEDSNLTAIFTHKAPAVPAGYGFDYVNADALIHALAVEGNHLHTPGGMSYRVLALDPYSEHMSLPVLRAIHKLVLAGAVVSGPKPMDDPSLADDQAEFTKLATTLFGDGTGVHRVGQGTVYAGQTLDETLKALNVAPDFDHTKPESDTRILFAHRKAADSDIYFLDNRNDRSEKVDASFRISGKVPELWHAESGESEAVSYSMADGRTTIPLHLEPWGTVFVVFRKATSATSLTVPAQAETELATLTNPWQLAFGAGRGAPASITVDKLASWSENADLGVKYFSGVGTYTSTIDAPAAWFKPGAKIWIDLGDVQELAELSVNGRDLGQVWHTPFRFDATTALHPGANKLSIKITNAWVNRLIGDAQPDVKEKITFTTVHPYRADSKLVASGLLGPVRVLSVSSK